MSFGLALWLSVGLLVAVNLLNNRFARAAYLPTSVLAATVLLVLFGLAGLPWSAAGLGTDSLARGLGGGLVLVVVVALVYAVGAWLKPTRGLFLDHRVAGVGNAEVAYQTLVRIPFGTVALEEVAFRGVLFGLAVEAYGTAWAFVLSSALFGLWHALPSLGLFQLNRVAGRVFAGRTALGVAAAVIASGLAGAVLCEVRRRTGSLAPVILLHWAINAFGYLTARVVTRTAGRV